MLDITYGKENVRVSCVNSIDRSNPEYVEYSTERIPREGVNLNLDPNFLVCCDCTDDCQDKEKCQCWQLTIKVKYKRNISNFMLSLNPTSKIFIKIRLLHWALAAKLIEMLDTSIVGLCRM